MRYACPRDFCAFKAVTVISLTPSIILILSVTGGAESFVLPPSLLSNISDGLVSSASDMNTWIVTGGTDSGVMKLVGDVMAKACLENQNPIIGIGE